MLVDLFSKPETAGLFYTNDNKVLIDILVRQLSDLSAGNPVCCLLYLLYKFYIKYFILIIFLLDTKMVFGTLPQNGKKYQLR